MALSPEVFLESGYRRLCRLWPIARDRFAAEWKCLELNFAAIGTLAFGKHKLRKAEWAVRPAVP